MENGNGQLRKLYVGMHDGVCVLTSSDGGMRWEQGKVTPLAHAAARLAVSYADPGRAYLAAYEAGVYRTGNSGHSWQRLPSYPSDYAHSVLVHPEDAQTIYVGSEPSAIFRSRDGGESWEECSGFRAVPQSSQWFFHSETRLSHVRDLRMAPHDPRLFYAGIEVGGVVRSSDGGETWRQLDGTDPDIHMVNLSTDQPSRVYIASAAGPYRSDDGGVHWELIDQGLQRSYAVNIAAAPDDAELVLLTVSRNAGRESPQFHRSTNGGRSWQQIDSVGTAEDMVVAVDWDPFDLDRVYAGTDGGRVYCSDDRGASWKPLEVSLSSVAVGALVVGLA